MKTPQSDCKWLAAQFKPNSHMIALRNLERQGFGTFLPLYKKAILIGRRSRAILRPLFPGYVFVSYRPNDQSWQTINHTNGITRLVSAGDTPLAVPTRLIEDLRARCDDQNVFHPLESIKPGTQVKIEVGPFANFLATVDEVESDRRVWLLIDLLGRTNRVNASIDAFNLN